MGVWLRRLWIRVPHANPRALTLLMLFTGVQVLDALLTWTGIARFGAGAEANPILSFYIALVGPGATLGVAKSVALCGGCMLYVRSHYVVLALLTLVYIFGAVMPWLWVLGT